MDLVKKDVKYLNKDFAQFRQNLINFAKQYYPDSYQDFNESSPGMMFIEMASYVGDVLSYYTDSSFRESLLNSATEQANVLQLAQMFGYKPTLNTPAVVDLDVFQLVPAIGTGDNAAPDTRYALSIRSGMRAQAETGTSFRTLEQVDFTQDTATSPLEVSVYEVDGANNVTYYLYKKTVKAVAGEVKTLTFNFTDPKPYDKIVLPDTNILDIISVTSDTGNKWYEVDYLAQDTIFEDIANIPFNDPTLSVYQSTVPYILKLRRTARRFVKRVRDDMRVELQFGAGVSSDADEELIPNPKNVGMGLEYLNRTTLDNVDPTNFLHTSTYGIAPNNETLTVQYTIGGDINENVAANTIVNTLDVQYNTDQEIYGVNLDFVRSSVAVNNPVAATGGKTFNNVDSIRQDAMAAFAAQNRAITREDYIARCYAMPAKYGSIAKAYIIGDTQKDTADKDYPRDTISNPMALNLYTLSLDVNGNFTTPNPAIRENLRTYLSNYRMLTDAINIKTAYIVNLGVEFEVIPKPSENSSEVVLRCINELKRILSNDRMQINGPLNISNLISQLDRLDGVQSIPSLEFTNLYDTNAGYSGNVYDIRSATKNGTLYPSLDPCIFEIKYPNQDIKGRVVKP